MPDIEVLTVPPGSIILRRGVEAPTSSDQFMDDLIKVVGHTQYVIVHLADDQDLDVVTIRELVAQLQSLGYPVGMTDA